MVPPQAMPREISRAMPRAKVKRLRAISRAKPRAKIKRSRANEQGPTPKPAIRTRRTRACNMGDPNQCIAGLRRDDQERRGEKDEEKKRGKS